MTLSSFVAKTGENPNFVAFMAHFGFGFFVMAILSRLGILVWLSAPACIIVAAVKEFWFDLRYEKTPPQTVRDSAMDFAGYLPGILVGAAVFFNVAMH